MTTWTTRRAALLLAAAVALGGAASGCVSPAAPAPAQLRTQAPPWDAPRDAVSYIEAAELPQLPLNDTSDPKVIALTVVLGGTSVSVPGNIGIDRVRAIQAPVHTHSDDGKVWLEGQGNREVTLGQFFTLWGVRLDASCVGDRCGSLTVTVDGSRRSGDPRDLVLRSVARSVEITVS